MAATILLPKERYSYYENRNLSAFPEISVESIANGKVFGELETMFCDYAAWRTAALRAVTWCDLNLFSPPRGERGRRHARRAARGALHHARHRRGYRARGRHRGGGQRRAARSDRGLRGDTTAISPCPASTPTTRTQYPAYLENRAAYTAAERGAPRGHGGAGASPMWTWARSLMPRPSAGVQLKGGQPLRPARRVCDLPCGGGTARGGRLRARVPEEGRT